MNFIKVFTWFHGYEWKLTSTPNRPTKYPPRMLWQGGLNRSENISYLKSYLRGPASRGKETKDRAGLTSAPWRGSWGSSKSRLSGIFLWTSSNCIWVCLVAPTVQDSFFENWFWISCQFPFLLLQVKLIGPFYLLYFLVWLVAGIYGGVSSRKYGYMSIQRNALQVIFA